MGIFSYFQNRAQLKAIKELGMTPEEIKLIQEDQQNGNIESALKRIENAQAKKIAEYQEITGMDFNDLIIDIGTEISWLDIVNHTFRILDFDRNDTIINEDNQVIAKNSLEPYGYLISESPIVNPKVRIPIINNNDFRFADNAFNNPQFEKNREATELLVTYSPKRLLPNGFSASLQHVLHFVLTPYGIIDEYYSFNNDCHMNSPNPQLIFGPFDYDTVIFKVPTNKPKL